MGSFDEAVAALRRGDVVVFPTETVWGIGASITSPRGVARIYEIKGRPEDRALQVLVASAAWMTEVARAGPEAIRLAERFMPGPLTIVLPARDGVPDLGGAGTIGVRAPAHPVALALLAAAGPVAASSANRSGEPTPRTLDEVRAIFGDDVDAYVDGEAGGGIPSTVVDLTGAEPVVLRMGPIGADRLAEVLGGPVG